MFSVHQECLELQQFLHFNNKQKRKPLNLKLFVNSNKKQYCPKVKGILGCISNAPRRIERKINLFIFRNHQTRYIKTLHVLVM